MTRGLYAPFAIRQQRNEECIIMKLNVIDNGYEKHGYLLKKTIESKIPIIYETDGMQIELCMNNQMLSTESYLITGKDNDWKITGSDELGLYYGIGKFLHSAKWTETEFVPNLLSE